MTKFIRLLSEAFSGLIPQTNSEEMVRLFRTEYNADYRNAIKSGATVDAEFVKTYLHIQ